MKINPLLLSFSCAGAAAVLWTAKSAAVFALTILAINLSGDAGYLDFNSYDWRYALIQFARLLIIWSGGGGLAGWLIAVLYNFFTEICEGEIKLK